MKHRKSLLQMIEMILALLLLAGCGATGTSPTPTPTPVHTPGRSTATPISIRPAVTPTLEATLPVNLTRPIVLVDNQIKLTVTGVGPVEGEGAYIQPAHQKTSHLLQVTASVENLTQQQFWFGPDPNSLEEQGQAQTNYKLFQKALGIPSSRFLSLKDKGTELKVGGDESRGQLSSWGYGAFALQPGSLLEVKVAFVVPNQATQLTASLITVSFK